MDVDTASQTERQHQTSITYSDETVLELKTHIHVRHLQWYFNYLKSCS